MSTYTVRSGETLSGIASRNNLNLNDIISANPQIKNPNQIFAGQRISIPERGQLQGQPVTRGTTPGERPASAGGTYTVRPGDTLSGIASRNGTTVNGILGVNPQIKNPNMIFAGQRISLPGASSAPRPSSPASAPSPLRSYTVKSGDTLSGIAARNGVSLNSLLSANPQIKNPNLINVGQRINLPGGVSTGSAPAEGGPVTGPAPSTGSTNGGVSLAELRAIMPTLPADKAQAYLPFLNSAMREFGITTPPRQAAFLAQLAHESGELKFFEELSSGAQYEGRTDLGNLFPGDGVRYKGRGPIQLTGRSNYRSAGQALGINLEANPTRAADPDVGFRIAGWFWNSRGLNSLADARNFDAITQRVNGGFNGKASRDAYYQRALNVLL